MRFYAHVNRNTLAANRKHGRRDPAICIRTRSKVREYVSSFDLPTGARIVQDEDNPLPCGARVWIEWDQ